MSILGKTLTAPTSGLKSIINVTAPTGSTVTCTTPSGVVLTAIEVSGTWAFVNLSLLGTYTINAALGTRSKSETVTVDVVGIYDVTIEYMIYLYNAGNECTSVTGGWMISEQTAGNTTVTRGSSSITVVNTRTGGTYIGGGITTTNTISCTDFTLLKITCTVNYGTCKLGNGGDSVGASMVLTTGTNSLSIEGNSTIRPSVSWYNYSVVVTKIWIE